jgi:hypothetical protein
VVEDICHPRTRQEDHEFGVSLGYVLIPCLKKNINIGSFRSESPDHPSSKGRLSSLELEPETSWGRRASCPDHAFK